MEAELLEIRARPHLLVVDDNEGMRTTLSDILDEQGFMVVQAANGLEAVDRVKKWSFSLVLMDVRMPVMDGIEALRRIKAIRPELPVIMMTAYSDAFAAGEARARGCMALLRKPLDMRNLLPLVQKIAFSHGS